MTAGIGSTSATSSALFHNGAPAVYYDQNGISGMVAYKNRAVNSDMSVSQVNGTTPVNPASATATYVQDQWRAIQVAAGTLSFAQVVDAPAGFKYSQKVTVTATRGSVSTDYTRIDQPIEGQNLIDLQYGLATAQTLAISLWVKSSVAGTYNITLINTAGTKYYVSTINVTTSWAKQTVIIAGDTATAFATDATVGLTLSIPLGIGSNLGSAALNTWTAGGLYRSAGTVDFSSQANTSTFQFTGVQVEAVPTGATQGTAFEVLPYETQLRRCQRYLPAINSPAGSFGGALFGYNYSTSTTLLVWNLPVQTRVPITGITTSAMATFTFQNGSNAGGTPVSLIFSSADQNIVQIVCTTTAGSPTIVAGQGSRIQQTGGTASQIYGTGAQL